MKAKKIYYKKLFALGNFENEEIGVELEIEEGEKAGEVLKSAKEFIELHFGHSNYEEKYKKFLAIVADPEAKHHEYVTALAFIERYEKGDFEDTLPF